MSRVFLTGGSGLIGGALAKRLVARGDEVVALARSDASARALEALGVAAVVRGDVLDEDGDGRRDGRLRASPTTWPASTRCARPIRRR